MAAKTPDVGTGATIGFSTSFFATATSFSWSGVSREALDTTTLATTAAKTYMPGDLYDGASVASAQLVPYGGDATYDILPSGDTGFYWANGLPAKAGVLLGSTLHSE